MVQKKQSYKYVVDGHGKKHRVPVDKNGNVPIEYLEKIFQQQSPKSQKADKNKVSKTVYPSNPRPNEAYQWIRNPNSSDISGLDSPPKTRVSYDEPKVYKAKKKKTGKAKAPAKKTAAKKTTSKKAPVKKKAEPKEFPVVTINPKKTSVPTASELLGVPKNDFLDEHVKVVAVPAVPQYPPVDRSMLLSKMPYSIVELDDGKVAIIEDSVTNYPDDPNMIGAMSYTIFDHGAEYDGGLMEYGAKDDLKALEEFISSASAPGMNMKRIVATAPSKEYKELNNALMGIQRGYPQDYQAIKGKYGLANQKSKKGWKIKGLFVQKE